MNLGTENAQVAVRHLSKLFPRWKATEEQVKLLVERWAKAMVSPEQIKAIVESHRMKRRGSDPDFGTLSELVNAAANQSWAESRRAQQRQAAAEPDGYVSSCPGEFCHRNENDAEWMGTFDTDVQDRIRKTAKNWREHGEPGSTSWLLFGNKRPESVLPKVDKGDAA